MNKKNASIVQKCYDLLKDAIPVINRFPRSQKFTLGNRIQNKISDLLECYITAYYADSQHKGSLLKDANIQLEVIRHYFRLAYDLGLYNSFKYQHFAEKLHEIGRMTGGWIKSLEKNKNRPPAAENKNKK